MSALLRSLSSANGTIAKASMIKIANMQAKIEAPSRPEIGCGGNDANDNHAEIGV